MKKEELYLDIGKWLNTKGYEYEFDKDGFWFEEYDFQEHKNKDIFDLMIEYHQYKMNQILLN